MVFAAGLALTLSCTAYADETTFVPGTSVNGLGISNMTVDQATQRIADFYASDYKLTIKEKGGKTEVITGPGDWLFCGTARGVSAADPGSAEFVRTALRPGCGQQAPF